VMARSRPPIPANLRQLPATLTFASIRNYNSYR